MNNTALGAENKRNRQSILSAKHMKNSTMKIKRGTLSGCVPQGTLLLPWYQR